MNKVNHTISLDPVADRFFTRISEQAGVPMEQLLADALFQYAGKLAVTAIKNVQHKQQSEQPNST